MATTMCLSAVTGCADSRTESTAETENTSITSVADTTGAKTSKITETDVVTPPAGEALTESTEKATTWDKSSDDISSRVAFALSADDFVQKFEALVDISEYSVTQKDGYASCRLDTEYQDDVDYNIDKTIKLYDGTVITVPTDFANIAAMGWETRYTDDSMIPNTVQTGIDYTNENGDKIVFWTRNPVDGTDEDKYAPLKDCPYYSMFIDLYKTDYKKDEAENIAPYYKKNPSPDFVLCSGITQASTISEIIEILGKPISATYDESARTISFNYDKTTENNKSTYLGITFATDGEYMIKITVS